MKLPVLSDIHGNVRALRAVIRDLDHRDVEKVANLADSFYGSVDPRPLVKFPSRKSAPTCGT